MAAKNKSTLMITVENSFEEDIYVDDSLSWEVIDPSDDDSDNFSYDSSVEIEIQDVEVDVPINDVSLSTVGSPESDLTIQSLVEHVDLHRRFAEPEVVGGNDEIDGVDYNDHVVDDDEDENDEDENDEYDLDDELVPKWVTDRFERQRMRKLGKRAYTKMKNSKRLPYMYNRPGCVHGKHGLGLKHSLI